MESPNAKRKAVLTNPGTSRVVNVGTFLPQVMPKVSHGLEPPKLLSSTAQSTIEEFNQSIPDYSILNDWPKSIEKVVKAVVSIHFSSVTPFDTERTYVSEATGFVVDAEKGIIMTNRHVVGPGPFMGYAVFDNHEESPVKPIYRDPVHDFGFLKYEPESLKHIQIEALNLTPEKAQVGCEIRVVGNDAGEKLSILSGFISRVDRNAPDYGDMSYNDFNTEYIQAAASASGGSSGSPVVDCKGDVVALQAGGSSVASTDFFLPLFRAQRALECLKSGTFVSRGTIQVRWLIKPYDECIRLGLPPEEEEAIRNNHPDSIGMLVAECILPGGPASKNQILEGDCLVSADGVPISKFRQLEAVLDSNIGKSVQITVIRNGEKQVHLVDVQNLFDITPDRFVRVSGAVFHNLSYQIASYYCLPVSGVYVAYTGTYFNPTSSDEYTGWILDELDFKPTPDLDTFIKVVLSIPTNKKVSAKFRHVSDPHTIVTSIVTMNRQWADGPQDFELVVCNNETGYWDFTQLGPGQSSEVLKKESATFVPLNYPTAPPSILALNNSIVSVSMLRPAMLEGFTISESKQHGFVVDAERGLVLVSRFCVPHYLVDISITVAESVILPAKVIFLHPQLGYAIIKYDPNLIDSDLRSIELGNHKGLMQGTKLNFLGYDSKDSAYAVETRITDIATTQLPIGFDVAPRFRATNVDAIGVDSSIIPELDSGLLADPETGVVNAIWLSFLGDVNVSNRRDRMFRFALDAPTIGKTIEQFKAVDASEFNSIDPRFLDFEVKPLKFASARIYKVPDEWISMFEKAEATRLKPQLLVVSRVASTLSNILFEGDVLLKVDKDLALNVSQLYDLDHDQLKCNLEIIRSGVVMAIEVPTTATSQTITKSLVSWCGMSLHKPHHAVLQQVKTPPSQVYIVGCHSGSPANMYGLFPTIFVTHVNGIPTPDLDTFYRIAKTVADNTYVKMRVVTFDGIPQALSLRTNYHYFPTWRIDLDMQTGDWKRYDDSAFN
ncbi:Nma111 protein [Starmerella bacillaris]|uniref:Pro-apoptotic serine protease NMA111 n=1 Tax=Starmerella bacillaris TaxID=1247836 RepID=A0AAV5RMY6_STABA|nr:Nma111 protein [Starmerella bacillaris]